MKILQSEKAPKAVGAYSQGVFASGFLFLSGQLAIDPETDVFLGGSVEEQTRQILKNIQALLADVSLTTRDIVKCNIYLADINDFGAVNQIYSESFSFNPPARSTVAVTALPKGAKVLIDCIVNAH